MQRALFVTFTIMFIFLSTCPAIAQTEQESCPYATHPSPVANKAVDVLLVRPACLVGSIISTAAFIVISVPAYMLGAAEPIAWYMVNVPWRYTACRPLGDFSQDSYKDNKDTGPCFN